MKSNTVILWLCWVLYLIHWTTDIFPGGYVPLAATASYLIMWLFGMFKNEAAEREALIDAGREIHDNLSDRQKDFIEKMRQGREEGYQPDEDAVATINMMDEDGNRSSVMIMEDGEVKITGNPNPDIIEAVKTLHKSVLENGPEAIAEEIGRQIDKINRGED